MNVLIKETNEVKVLPVAIDFKNDYDWTNDLIGNHASFSSTIEDVDGHFVRIESLDNKDDYEGVDAEYITSAENFDWWESVINTMNKGESLIFENSDILTDEINEKLEDANYYRDLDLVAEKRLEIIEDFLN